MSFLNIPFSLLEKRWFSDEMAVRAWVFLASRSLYPKLITIKNKNFDLKAGESICTRSYLSKSLKINDSSAKGVTDKLKRSKSLFQEIESLGKGFRNKISRIKVDGIPNPEEAYLPVPMGSDISIFYKNKCLAQLYIYLMLSAAKFDNITIAGGKILEVKRGELVVSYKEIQEKLKISEYYLKKTIHLLEGLGLLEKSRCGNDGLFVKMTNYPAAPARKEKVSATEKVTESDVVKTELKSEPAAVQQTVKPTVGATHKEQQPVQQVIHVVENSIHKGLPSDEWEGWIQNSATEAIVWYSKRRRWKDIDRINLIIQEVGETGLDMCYLIDWLKRLWNESGNNVKDERGKPVFVDSTFIIKGYAFYLKGLQQKSQVQPSSNYSSSNQQSQQPVVNLGSEQEIKDAQAIFLKMAECIGQVGEKEKKYVQDWMSVRKCCVSGVDVETMSLYIDLFEEIKEKWVEDKEFLFPWFKKFYGDDIKIYFNIIKHSA